eukprot:CAMPEP_0202959306 /NCGR_PEP_ID=MMETSP1396-20130829/3526_1 /ASSEMBLY_ACC=CAM_ASM_000872 /TAXON_ID= /ORGANISM="Pseudokeronopsis sp., Strain Brazil" /LENGTH=54 /DNA_ID=CAMNT_0049677805 /DNA_START=442 /DNA_END=606 /DNA_ORIENTATION=+
MELGNKLKIGKQKKAKRNSGEDVDMDAKVNEKLNKGIQKKKKQQVKKSRKIIKF